MIHHTVLYFATLLYTALHYNTLHYNTLHETNHTTNICNYYANLRYIKLHHAISQYHFTALHCIALHGCLTHHNNTRHGAPSGAENGLDTPFAGDNKTFVEGTVVKEVVSGGVLGLRMKSANRS